MFKLPTGISHALPKIGVAEFVSDNPELVLGEIKKFRKPADELWINLAIIAANQFEPFFPCHRAVTYAHRALLANETKTKLQ